MSLNDAPTATGVVVTTGGLFTMKLLRIGFLFLLAICLNLYCRISVAGEEEVFERERLKMVDEIAEVLVRNGVCKNPKEGCKGIDFFALPMNGGFYITTYGITDMVVLNEVASKVMALHAKNGVARINMYSYGITKEESETNFFLIDVPFLRLELKRSQ